jgi:hypothetical protein
MPEQSNKAEIFKLQEETEFEEVFSKFPEIKQRYDAIYREDPEVFEQWKREETNRLHEAYGRYGREHWRKKLEDKAFLLPNLKAWMRWNVEELRKQKKIRSEKEIQEVVRAIIAKRS